MNLLKRVQRSISDVVHNSIHGMPDAIVIGETHRDVGNSREQAELIERYRPEIVLLEMFDDVQPEKLAPIIDTYRTVTLRELATEYGINLNDLAVDCAVSQAKKDFETANKTHGLSYLLEEQLSDLRSNGFAFNPFDSGTPGVLPVTRAQALDTPIYELNIFTNKCFIDLLTSAKDLSEKEQFAVTDKFKKISYKLRTHSLSEHPGSSYVFRAVANVGAQIAGCDLKDKLNKSKAGEKNLTYKREQEMGSKIARYCGQRKSQEPVVAIVGLHHTRKDSAIFPVLDEHNITYRAINQEQTFRTAAEIRSQSILHLEQLGLIDFGKSLTNRTYRRKNISSN